MKNILSILLVIVMVLTLTACVDNTDAQSETTETAPAVTAELIAEVITSGPTTILPEKFLWVDEIWAMSSEEISTYLADLVYISESKSLSSEEMYQLGNYFHGIWWYKEVSGHGEFDFNMEEYATQSYKAFNNIYEQAIEQQIPLNEIKSWAHIPVADVLYKYFSSDNFSETKNIASNGFYELPEEEALLVLKAVFENPLFATNVWIAIDALHNSSTEIQEMGWAHLLELAKNSDQEVAEQIAEAMYDTEAANKLLELLEENSDT